MEVSCRGDDQVRRRQTVVARPGKLSLGIDGAVLHLGVDGYSGEVEEGSEQTIVIGRVSRRVPRREKKRQADANPSAGERLRHPLDPIARERLMTQASPRRVVDQERGCQGPAQLRRAASAASASTGTSPPRIQSATSAPALRERSLAPRRRASFSSAPSTTSSPRSSRPAPSSPRRRSRASWTGGVSVIAWRRRLVGISDASVTPGTHLMESAGSIRSRE